MDKLRAEALTLAYDSATIIENLEVSIPANKITTLVGPNGCGKSTLLRGMARLLTPKAGTVYLDGKHVHKIPTKELAKQLGILPQGPVAPEGLTVRELVAQGRYPHQHWFEQWSTEDERMLTYALELTGLVSFAARPVDSLSGGERQRAWIALTLAQNTSVLLLDEPTTFLDIGHQLEVLDLVRNLNRERQMTIVMVLHDLNQAARFSDRMIALCQGRVVAEGTPHEVIAPVLLAEVFGVLADVMNDPRSGAPLCMPYATINQVNRDTGSAQQRPVPDSLDKRTNLEFEMAAK
jgi:iron complex transport system ATP-binding protein